MALFNKAKLASLSPTTPPNNFQMGKKPKKLDKTKTKAPSSGLMNYFGKK